MPPPNDAAPTIPGGPRTAIVIVTYNSADVLAECLHSLADGAIGVRLTDVIVADNASRDDSIVIAKEAADLPVRVVEVGRNAGYAAAINVGTDALNLDELDAVFVMNPDCRLRPGVLAVLAGCLAERGRGIAVPRLTNPDGTLQPSLRRAPSVFRALAEAVIGGRLAGRIGTLGELITDPREYETPRAAVWATGAAMLVSVAAIGRIGPWDESFLLYSEETEYILRAADLGLTLWYEPAAVVEHIGGESSTNPMLAALLAVNKVRLFWRRRGPVAGSAYYLAVVFGEGLRALTGRPTSRSAFVALVRPSRRIRMLAG
ncbi:MAG: glycosyl transferase family 2 [Actinomycetia bacterium]|nr:glycosyl transferase family 2 [Actinomycetes bacterium]